MAPSLTPIYHTQPLKTKWSPFYHLNEAGPHLVTTSLWQALSTFWSVAMATNSINPSSSPLTSATLGNDIGGSDIFNGHSSRESQNPELLSLCTKSEGHTAPHTAGTLRHGGGKRRGMAISLFSCTTSLPNCRQNFVSAKSHQHRLPLFTATTVKYNSFPWDLSSCHRSWRSKHYFCTSNQFFQCCFCLRLSVSRYFMLIDHRASNRRIHFYYWFVYSSKSSTHNKYCNFI